MTVSGRHLPPPLTPPLKGEGEKVSSATGNLIAILHQFLDRFTTSGPLLVAFSGGGDSTALLWALAKAMAARPDFSLHAATVDHGLRQGSAEEAVACGEFASRLGIGHSILTWQGEKPATGIQAAARAARYRLLEEEAHRLGAVAILTAHNADDQIETILMREKRGAGEGLSGMAPAVLLCGRTWLLRPLLGLSRETLRQALRDNGLAWIEDPSNQNPRFERVRIRQAGEREEPLDAEQFSRQRALLAHAQAGWLKDHAEVFGQAVGRITPEGCARLGDPDAQLALFKLAAALGDRPFLPPAESRARILPFLLAGQPGRMTLAGLVFDRRSTGLYLYREARGRPPVAQDGSEAKEFARLLEAGVPDAIAKRAAPAMSARQDEREGAARQIAAYSRFLPSFELPVAECLVSLFGFSGLPAPPLRLTEACNGPAAAFHRK